VLRVDKDFKVLKVRMVPKEPKVLKEHKDFKVQLVL
jgi:hypothetical protein